MVAVGIEAFKSGAVVVVNRDFGVFQA